MMNAIRWWMFVKLSAFGWRICPEPHKSRLLAAMPSWDDIARCQAPRNAAWRDD